MTHRIHHLGRALRPVCAVWALLVAITLVSAVESAGPAPMAVLGLVTALTAAKVALVMFQYMEVGHAPLWLKAACAAWIVVAMGGVAALTLFPHWSVSLLR